MPLCPGLMLSRLCCTSGGLSNFLREWAQDGDALGVSWPLPSFQSIEYIKCTLLALAATPAADMIV